MKDYKLIDQQYAQFQKGNKRKNENSKSIDFFSSVENCIPRNLGYSSYFLCRVLEGDDKINHLTKGVSRDLSLVDCFSSIIGDNPPKSVLDWLCIRNVEVSPLETVLDSLSDEERRNIFESFPLHPAGKNTITGSVWSAYSKYLQSIGESSSTIVEYSDLVNNLIKDTCVKGFQKENPLQFYQACELFRFTFKDKNVYLKPIISSLSKQNSFDYTFEVKLEFSTQPQNQEKLIEAIVKYRRNVYFNYTSEKNRYYRVAILKEVLSYLIDSVESSSSKKALQALPLLFDDIMVKTALRNNKSNQIFSQVVGNLINEKDLFVQLALMIQKQLLASKFGAQAKLIEFFQQRAPVSLAYWQGKGRFIANESERNNITGLIEKYQNITQKGLGIHSFVKPAASEKSQNEQCYAGIFVLGLEFIKAGEIPKIEIGALEIATAGLFLIEKDIYKTPQLKQTHKSKGFTSSKSGNQDEGKNKITAISRAFTYSLLTGLPITKLLSKFDLQYWNQFFLLIVNFDRKEQFYKDVKDKYLELQKIISN